MKLVKSSLIVASMLLTSLSASSVVATVNGKNITQEDANMFVQVSAPQSTFESLTNAQKKMVVERLVERELFIAAAKKEGIEKKPEFAEHLAKIKDEILINLWMQEQMNNTIVSNSEAKDFYTKNNAKYKTPQKAKAKHILVKTEDEAKKIIAQMKALKGEELKKKFVELAKSKSVGPSKVNGGDLGEFSGAQMVPEFSKATFALKDGTITTAPVKTQFGFHIIYLEKLIAESTVKFDDVKENIIQQLKQQQFNTKVTEVSKELKSKAKISIVDLNKTK
ncbi:MAG: peptidylprolyl isomerase [Campylobacterota bacterium]|nr:peptidylprolyl isomerase [Campylobacterota bacterium]